MTDFRKPFPVKRSLPVLLIFFCILLLYSGCNRGGDKTATAVSGFQSVLLFIPGVVEGNPVYEMLADGVKQAVNEQDDVELHILEGGFSQGEWEEQLTAAAATGQYDLFISSNPALPDLCLPLVEKFPDLRFLILDSFLEGNPSIYTFQFNQWEQAYITGYAAGLITKSGLPGTNPDGKAGFIAAQEYPVMNDILQPYYLKGFQAAVPDGTVDFRVIGNWYDAARASELAAELYASGSDVILTIAGGANQGVLSEAAKQGKYVMWFDSNGYSLSEGVVAGSSVMQMTKAAYMKTSAALNNSLEFGTAEIGGVKEGFVDFISDDPVYVKSFPESVRLPVEALLEQMNDGTFKLP